MATAAQAQVYGVLAGGNQQVPSDDAGALAIINESTGAATIVGTPLPGVSLTGLAIDNSARFFASTSDSRLIEIDPSNGSLVLDIGTFDAGQGTQSIQDLAFDPVSGNVYAVSADGGPDIQDQLYIVNLATAALTSVGSMDHLPGGFTGIAFTSDGRLWGTTTEGDLGEFDPATGALLDTIPFSQGNGGPALGARFSDDVLFVAECCNNQLLLNEISSITTTGTVTPLGPAGLTRRVHDFAWAPQAVPNPNAGGLALPVPTGGPLGLALLAFLVAMFGVGALLPRAD